MGNQREADYYTTDPTTGRKIPGYVSGSPGISGALYDAIKALAMAFAPKSITQAPQRMQQQEQQALGDQVQQ